MNETPIFKFAIREDLRDADVSFIPTRATPRSAGWDVRAAQKDKKPITIWGGKMVKIPLGFRTFCPEGWWFELKPRSSSFAKKHLHCLYGTIDEDYEGELILAAQLIPDREFVYYNHGNERLDIEFGEAIGQIIPVKRNDMITNEVTNEEYDALCLNRNAERGAGGFGSSGK